MERWHDVEPCVERIQKAKNTKCLRKHLCLNEMEKMSTCVTRSADRNGINAQNFTTFSHLKVQNTLAKATKVENFKPQLIRMQKLIAVVRLENLMRS